MRRWTTIVLLAAVAGVQADLWLGRSNMPQVMSLSSQLEQQQAVNAQARARNAQVLAEVSDLKEGLEMVEEKARAELGMLRPDEIFVHVARAPGTPATAGGVPAAVNLAPPGAAAAPAAMPAPSTR